MKYGVVISRIGVLALATGFGVGLALGGMAVLFSYVS